MKFQCIKLLFIPENLKNLLLDFFVTQVGIFCNMSPADKLLFLVNNHGEVYKLEHN